MTQETVERNTHPELDEVKGPLVDLDNVLEVIKQSTFLVTPQKDVLIKSLQVLHVIPGDNFQDVFKAYDKFKDDLKNVLEEREDEREIHFEDGERLVRDVFRLILGVNTDDLSTMESFETKQLVRNWTETIEPESVKGLKHTFDRALNELNEKIQGLLPSYDDQHAD